MKRRGFFGALVGTPAVAAASIAASKPATVAIDPRMVGDVEYWRAARADVDALRASLAQLREQCDRPIVVRMSIGGRTTEIASLDLSKKQ